MGSFNSKLNGFIRRGDIVNNSYDLHNYLTATPANIPYQNNFKFDSTFQHPSSFHPEHHQQHFNVPFYNYNKQFPLFLNNYYNHLQRLMMRPSLHNCPYYTLPQTKKPFDFYSNLTNLNNNTSLTVGAGAIASSLCHSNPNTTALFKPRPNSYKINPQRQLKHQNQNYTFQSNPIPNSSSKMINLSSIKSNKNIPNDHQRFMPINETPKSNSKQQHKQKHAKNVSVAKSISLTNSAFAKSLNKKQHTTTSSSVRCDYNQTANSTNPKSILKKPTPLPLSQVKFENYIDYIHNIGDEDYENEEESFMHFFNEDNSDLDDDLSRRSILSRNRQFGHYDDGDDFGSNQDSLCEISNLSY